MRILLVRFLPILEAEIDTDIIKRYIQVYIDVVVYDPKIFPSLKFKYSTQSRIWVQWLTVILPGACAYCADMQSPILRKDAPIVEWPPVHKIAIVKSFCSSLFRLVHLLRELSQYRQGTGDRLVDGPLIS